MFHRVSLIMKCLALVTLMLLPLFAQDHPAALRIQLTGIQSTKGQLRLLLFKESAGFPDEPAKAWRKLAVPVPKSGESVEVLFEDVPAGSYAVTAMQDENNNGKLDHNFIGAPKEPWGVSNNVRPNMAPPKFTDARFDFDGKTKLLQIKLSK